MSVMSYEVMKMIDDIPMLRRQLGYGYYFDKTETEFSVIDEETCKIYFDAEYNKDNDTLTIKVMDNDILSYTKTFFSHIRYDISNEKRPRKLVHSYPKSYIEGDYLIIK